MIGAGGEGGVTEGPLYLPFWGAMSTHTHRGRLELLFYSSSSKSCSTHYFTHKQNSKAQNTRQYATEVVPLAVAGPKLCS